MSDKVMTPEQTYNTLEAEIGCVSRDTSIKCIRRNNLAIARQAREACAKAACPECADGQSLESDGDSVFHYVFVRGDQPEQIQCLASAIHALSDAKLLKELKTK